MLTAADVAALDFHHSVLERPGTISIHTHGLAKHGVREVEIHGVPACLHHDACVVLARVGVWLVFRRDIGETVASGDHCTMSPTIRVRLRDAEPLRCCDEDQHAMPQTEVLFLPLRHRLHVTLPPRPELIASRTAPSGGRS